MRYLIVLLFLVGCGGGGSSKVEAPKPEPVKKDTIEIYQNSNYTSLSDISSAIANGYQYTIVSAVYSQTERDRVSNCIECFNLNDSVIIGNDNECTDCLNLSTFLDYSERDNGIKAFIVIEDSLTFEFAQSIVSTRGYSNIVLVSSYEDILSLSVYNYELGFVGVSSNYDWNITPDKECPVKCIHPTTDKQVSGDYDGVIVE